MTAIRKTKYHSVSCQCRQGHYHKSRAEAGYCNELRLRQRSRDRTFYCYEPEQRFPLTVNGVHICDHYLDFTLMDKDKRVLEVHEVKGFATAEWRIKQKLFMALYPKIPYKVVRV